MKQYPNDCFDKIVIDEVPSKDDLIENIAVIVKVPRQREFIKGIHSSVTIHSSDNEKSKISVI